MNQFTASLWGDEAWAATLAVKSPLQIIQIVARDTSPPLYYLVLHFWMEIFGTSEIAIRGLSFLFFLATVLVVYLIGKHLWDKKTGILAAFLALTNPFLFIYAFEGRMYALLLLTSTLSVYFFLKKNRLGFILATTAALYTHHFSIFVIFWEGFWRLSQFWRQPIRKILKGLADFFIIGLLYLPWLYPLYYQTSLVASGFWLGKPTFYAFRETIRKFLVGTGGGNWETLVYWMIILALVLRQWQKKVKNSIFLVGWFLVPLILTFLISQFFQPIFFDRYLLMVIPATSLLLASNRRRFSLFLILASVILLGILNWHYFNHPTKRPFRELANFIKKEANELTLINYNAAAHHLWESKYYGLKAPLYTPQPLPFYVGTALMEEGDILTQLPEEKLLGVITSASLGEVKLQEFHQINLKQLGELKFLWMAKD